MRYALLPHSGEPTAENPVDPELIEQVKQAMGRYARALTDAGVLVAAEVLQPQTASTTVSRRSGTLQVQDGPFAETKEALAGVFVLEVPDLDAALGWAEKHPTAGYGVIEVRPVAVSVIEGEWVAPDAPARPQQNAEPRS